MNLSSSTFTSKSPIASASVSAFVNPLYVTSFRRSTPFISTSTRPPVPQYRAGRRAHPYFAPTCRASPVPPASPRDADNSSSLSPVEADAVMSTKYQPLSALLRIARSLWAFSRPHTIYGTIISVTSVTLVAAQTIANLPFHTLWPAYITALIPACLLNVYIVGLNQIHDVPIDKVNKPYLPLASGAMTMTDAYITVAVSLIAGLAFCVAAKATMALRVVLIGSVLLGTIYSMPPLRLKRFPLLASMAILTVRGLLVNVGFFLHAMGSSAGLMTLPLITKFAAVFFTVFGLIIALCKDVPDVRGDRLFGVRTFSVRVGPRVVFGICVGTLVSMFLGGGVFYLMQARSMLTGVMAMVSHWVVALVLLARGRGVDAEKSGEVTSFYMLLWKAFYLEYLLLPLVAL